ncbi:hypothetical protein [Streptomyces sp. TLI_171]|uniref:hypothetical protein n=1 Tax=Streptomyces sp. TLI_171 TaxID=1938859 RepID=UPI001180AE2F|nr:hypothetical protein [Streptomyces sp. TLI_171]
MDSSGNPAAPDRDAHLAQDREFAARALPGAMAMQRRAWARGERGGLAEHVEVAGPDRVPVRIRVRWLGTGDPTLDGRGDSPWVLKGNADPIGLFAVVMLVVGIVMGVAVACQWLALELTGRPHWAVTAAVGTAPATAVVVLRSRRARAAAVAAAELADRVAREGSEAVGPRPA